MNVNDITLLIYLYGLGYILSGVLFFLKILAPSWIFIPSTSLLSWAMLGIGLFALNFWPGFFLAYFMAQLMQAQYRKNTVQVWGVTGYDR